MKQYDFYISYASRDGVHLARELWKLLTENGYSVFFDLESFSAGGGYTLSVGDDYTQLIPGVIRDCGYFIALITEQSSESSWAKQELNYAVSTGKTVFPVLFQPMDSLSLGLRLQISHLQCFFAKGIEDLPAIAETFGSQVGVKRRTELLYEKLAEYSKVGHQNRKAETVCELLELARKKIPALPLWHEYLEAMKEIYRLYEILAGYSGAYDGESRAVAHKILKQIDGIKEHLSSRPTYKKHIYCISWALHILYLDREIRKECADITTHGGAVSACPVSWYIEQQEEYAAAFSEKFDEDSLKADPGFSEEDLQFIRETPKFIFKSVYEQTDAAPAEAKPRRAVPKPLSEEDEILHSVAKFMQEGNRLFDLLREQGQAGEFLKCLLTSYERLRNYCEVIGASSVAAECVDRIAEIRQQLALDRSSDNEDGKAEKGIKSLLGLTLRGTGNYDVFISFKSQDTALARSIYNFCNESMVVPFWSKVSLPELSKSDYADAIDQALDKSRHFVVVLSDLSYLEAHWVKYEMKTFRDEIREGRKEGSNFVIVATDEVYQQIIESNKAVLPIQYRWCQILRMSEYRTGLLPYLRS